MPGVGGGCNHKSCSSHFVNKIWAMIDKILWSIVNFWGWNVGWRNVGHFFMETVRAHLFGGLFIRGNTVILIL